MITIIAILLKYVTISCPALSCVATWSVTFTFSIFNAPHFSHVCVHVLFNFLGAKIGKIVILTKNDIILERAAALLVSFQLIRYSVSCFQLPEIGEHS